MAKLTIELGAKINNLKRGLADARSRVKKWNRGLSNLTKLALGVSLGSLSAGLAALTKRAVELAAKFQQTQVAFRTMVGDSERAAALIEALTEFSTKTPFTPEQVQKAARTLLAFGFAAEDVKGTLKILGDVSAGTGKDLTELAVIFGQIKSAGRLMGQDLLQLINAGFNPLQVMSEKTGKSVAQLKDEMSKGLITFDQVEQAFRDATGEGGLFNNMMEQQSTTVIGMLSTLKGNFDELLKTLGSGTTGALTDMLDKLNKIAESYTEIAKAQATLNESGDQIGFDKPMFDKLANFVSNMPVPTALEGFRKDLEQRLMDAAGMGLELGGPTGSEIDKRIQDISDSLEKELLEGARVFNLAGEDVTDRMERRDKAFSGLDAKILDDLTDIEAESNKALMDLPQIGEEYRRQQREQAKQGLRDAIKMNEERASELEKSIGAAFRPQGEIASNLARIGGERGIAIARNIPEKQLGELVGIRKGIEIMSNQLDKIDTTPRWPGGQ